MELEIKHVASTEKGSRFPVYSFDIDNDEPRPAFIELNLANGEASCGYEKEKNYIVSSPETLKLPIHPATSSVQIATLLDSVYLLFQGVLNGTSIQSEDKENPVKFNDSAMSIISDFFDNDELYPMQNTDEIAYVVPSQLLDQWIEDPFPNEGQDLEDYAKELYETDGMSNCYYCDDVTEGTILDCLIEKIQYAINETELKRHGEKKAIHVQYEIWSAFGEFFTLDKDNGNVRKIADGDELQVLLKDAKKV